MKKAIIQRKIASNILSNADGALLTVQHFVTAVISDHPIHHIQRKAVFNSFNYSIALFFFVHKLALIFWANIQFALVSRYSSLFVVLYITSNYFPNCNFM